MTVRLDGRLWAVLGAVFLFFALQVARDDGRQNERVQAGRDSLVTHVRALRADSARRDSIDRVTQAHIAHIAVGVQRDTAAASVAHAATDTATQALHAGAGDTSVSRDSLARLADSALAGARAEAAYWHAAFVKVDSQFRLERQRNDSLTAQLADVNADLARAIGQVALEERRSNPGLLKRLARDGPWLGVVYLAGRARVPL